MSDYLTQQANTKRTGELYDVFAPDNDINVKWAKQLQGNITGSIYVCEETVYIPASHDGLYAIDISDGKGKWTFQTDKKYIDASVTPDNRILLATSAGQEGPSTLYKIRKDGQSKWSYDYERGILPPICSSGAILVPVLQNKRPLDGIDENAVFMHSFSIDEQPRTINPIEDNVKFGQGKPFGHLIDGSPLAYISREEGNHDRILHTLDGIFGINWKYEFDATGPPSGTPAPSVKDNIVYVIDRNSVLRAIEAGSAIQRWSYDITRLQLQGPAHISRMAVTDDELFVLVNEGLLHLDPDSGDQRGVWSFDNTDVQFTKTRCSPPTVTKNKVIFGFGDEELPTGVLVALDRESMTKQWEIQMNGCPTTAPVVKNGTVLVGTIDGSIFTVEGENTDSISTVDSDESTIESDSKKSDPEITGQPTCPNCDNQLTGGEKFCPECGEEIVVTNCPSCGSELTGDENFCPECGQGL